MRENGMWQQATTSPCQLLLVICGTDGLIQYSNLIKNLSNLPETEPQKNLLLHTCWPNFLVNTDSPNIPFPTTSHRCQHTPKRCLPIQTCGNLPSFPLLFHPSTKGSQIIMDLSQRTVKRQASFCNAITFSNRPIAVYEQVRLKVNVANFVHVNAPWFNTSHLFLVNSCLHHVASILAPKTVI